MPRAVSAASVASSKCRPAVGAAMDVQRNFAEPGNKLAVALIGKTITSDDPLLSANLVHKAQGIVTRARGGEILCEAQVRLALRRQDGFDLAEDYPVYQGEDLDLVSLPVTEREVQGPTAALEPIPSILH